ncbi:MAG: hypothetical protein NTY68_04660 [Candidatus Micrarchaeota archaeon]|nr:hypothetical protein [Candidatus Micrarchaeota archaeon]
MKISLLGPTNMKKFSSIIGRDLGQIESEAREIGRIIAKSGNQLVVVFNYAGMLKLVGDSYKSNGGKLEMLYTENDYDWYTKPYMDHLGEADVKVKTDGWHDMLLKLVKDSDIVVCAGLSAGVFAELGYMKWNTQEKKGSVKSLIGIKEFIRDWKFPPELSFEMNHFMSIVPVSELENALKL